MEEERPMLRRATSLAYVAATILIAAPAQADWLESAFGDDVAATGGPAITLDGSGILLVLPEATLQKAHRAGVTTADAVKLLVQRYGQHCSDVLDLDGPHRHVKVQLFLSKPVALEDAPERVQGEILDTLKTAKRKPLPRVDSLFVTADDPTELFIDYVPEHRASCVEPGAEIS
jgi:hypothetical protein